MKNKNEQSNTQSLPLAIALPTSELKGWLSKHLEVPPGRLGIALFRNGKHQSFPSGENRVLTDLDRYKGDGAGFWAGYIPKEPFNALLTITNLVSGDEVLLDLSLLCSIKVNDPVRFFTEEVIPKRSIPSGTYMLGDPELFKSFSNLVRNYAAQDLVDGNLDADLVKRAYAAIGPIIQNQGLTLESINLVTCWRQEDRLVIEEQIFALQQKMADLEFDKKLAEIEDEDQLNTFLKMNDLDLAGSTRIAKSGETGVKQKSGNLIKAWISGHGEERQPGRNFRIKSLVIKKALDEANHTKQTRYKPKWWLPRTLWIILVLLIATVLTIVLRRASVSMAWAGRSEFYIAIWMFAVGAVLESATVIFKNWEQLFNQDLDGLKTIGLDQLKLKDRGSVDRIVRDQCKMELGLQKDILNEVRSRVYHDGDTDLALEMRRIELKIEEFQDRVHDETFGAAPYLRSDVKISEETWVTQMDNEEYLLIRAALLSEEAHNLQVKFSQSQLDRDALREFETDLDAFYKAFAIRERVLHTSEMEPLNH